MVVFRYREINDPIMEGKNERFSVKLLRITIRYAVRVFGLKTGVCFLSVFLFIIRILGRSFQQGVYLAQTNRFRLKSLIFFRKNDLEGFLKEKKQWLKYVLKNSKSCSERDVATDYLRLLGEDINGDISNKVCNSKDGFFNKVLDGKKFYVFGPNAAFPPSKKYIDYTLVLTKFPSFDLKEFEDCFLFLNFYTYSKLNSRELEEISHAYTRVFVNADSKTTSESFTPLASLGGGNVASMSGLSRLMLTLKILYPGSTYRIEGFDCYAKQTPYSGLISTYFPLNNYKETERLLSSSLFSHDPIYNFLKLQEIIKGENVSLDSALHDILSYSPSGYFRRLAAVRRFDYAL